MISRDFDIKQEVGEVCAGQHLWIGQPPQATEKEKGFRNWYASMQHVHVAEAMLLALRGTSGAMIYSIVDTNGELKFVASDNIDSESVEFLQPLLGMAADRGKVWATAKKLTTSFEYGLMNQSFGYALLDICLGIHELVCTVWDMIPVHDPLPLLLHEIIPYKPLMSLVSSVVDQTVEQTESGTQQLFGTKLLCVLETTCQSMALKYPNGEQLCKAIYNQTAVPFLEMISDWIYKGELSNFASAELPIVKPSESDFMTWEFNLEQTPLFIRSCASKVLQSGQLVKVIIKSGREYQPVKMKLTTDSDDLSRVIEDSWIQANNATLEMLRDDYQLLRLINFYQRYFLCGESSWLLSFLDGCSNKRNCSLTRTSKDVNWVELHQLLDSAIPPKDASFELSLEVAQSQLFRCLRGRSTFANTSLPLLVSLQLRLDVGWPSNLIFKPQCSAKYNFMFRLFFRVKSLKHDLGKCRRRRFALSKASSILLYAMLSLLHSLETYLAFEVVEPQYQRLVEIVKTTNTVEELVQSHETFIDQCLLHSLAHNEVYLKQLDKVFLSIRLFSEAAQYDLESLMVARFEKQFSERFQELFASLQEDSEKPGGQLIQHLIRRLDFNGFYRKRRQS